MRVSLLGGIMREVKGRYNGSVVILAEPVTVDHEVEVVVQFPEDSGEAVEDPRARHWVDLQQRLRHVQGNLSEEVIRQRQME